MNLSPEIQFHDKPMDNRDWYVMAGPEGSDAPLYVRQNVYIVDAHPKAGDKLEIPTYEGLTPFLYVMDGEITMQDLTITKQEAVTGCRKSSPAIYCNRRHYSCIILC